jgi:hypothetical protein
MGISFDVVCIGVVSVGSAGDNWEGRAECRAREGHGGNVKKNIATDEKSDGHR